MAINIAEQPTGSRNGMNQLEYPCIGKDSVTDLSFSLAPKKEQVSMLFKVLQLEKEMHTDLNFQSGYTHEKKGGKKGFKKLSFKEKPYFLNDYNHQDSSVAKEPDEKIASFPGVFSKDKLIVKLLDLEESSCASYSKVGSSHTLVRPSNSRVMGEREATEWKRLSEGAISGYGIPKLQHKVVVPDDNTHPIQSSGDLLEKRLESSGVWGEILETLEMIQKDILVFDDEGLLAHCNGSIKEDISRTSHVFRERTCLEK